MDREIRTNDISISNPLFNKMMLKFCWISSAPFRVLCRIINVNNLVSPESPVTAESINHHTNCTNIAIGADVKTVKNVPRPVTTITVGSNHHKIYFINASASIKIPVSAEYFISGTNDSKLKRITGSITAVNMARVRTIISFVDFICLLFISSLILFLLSFNQKKATIKTGYNPRTLVI